MGDYIDFEHNIIDVANKISKSNRFSVGKLYEAINYLIKSRISIINIMDSTFIDTELWETGLLILSESKKLVRKKMILCNKIFCLNERLSHYLKIC